MLEPRTPAVIITAEMRAKAWLEGRDAYECGLDAGDCPEYGGMTTLRLSWFQGFDSGDAI